MIPAQLQKCFCTTLAHWRSFRPALVRFNVIPHMPYSKIFWAKISVFRS